MFCLGDGMNVLDISWCCYIDLYLFYPIILIIRLNYLRDNIVNFFEGSYR